MRIPCIVCKTPHECVPITKHVQRYSRSAFIFMDRTNKIVRTARLHERHTPRSDRPECRSVHSELLCLNGIYYERQDALHTHTPLKKNNECPTITRKSLKDNAHPAEVRPWQKLTPCDIPSVVC